MTAATVWHDERMEPHDKEPANLIEKNPDGSFTKETLTRAMKALKKRLKLTRLDDESRLGMGSKTSRIAGITPPSGFGPDIWEELVAKGKLKREGGGTYSMAGEI